MTDVIHLDKISSGDCGCNKPKKSCGCSNTQPCVLSTPGGDTYFKVKNLFSELRSEWQRAEARSNLGTTDIIRLDLIKYGEKSGDSNTWQMVTTKGGDQRVYDFVVKNGEAGQDGKDATVEVFRTETLNPGSEAVVRNVTGNDSDVKLYFGIPAGETGPLGESGKSAFELAVENGFIGTLSEWLESLKGQAGDPGELIDSFQLTNYGLFSRTLPDGTKVVRNMFIWHVILTDGKVFEFWVPDGGQSSSSEDSSDKPMFLYKLVQFSSYPDSVQLAAKLSELLNSVNYADSGKLKSVLLIEGWWTTPPVIVNQGKDYIFMAVSTGNDTKVEPWAVVQLSGIIGPRGDDGSTGQGLVGPVIRMRGTWNNLDCYTNESSETYTNNNIRFIDIVEHEGNYWMVRPGVNCADKTRTPDENSLLWIQSEPFDFAFINTLIADYIISNSVDADEIRIHDRRNNGDIIVAGMTGGRTLTGETLINTDNTNDPIRIWAGTNVDIKNKELYNLDLSLADFRVTQNGKLIANNAEILGIIEALTLRLKTLVNGEGTFILPLNTNSITLPNLPGDKIQMFYVLTNLVVSDILIEVPSNSNDTILGQSTYTAKPFKLYLLFGINSTWYVIELDLSAASTIIDNDGGILTNGLLYNASGTLKISTVDFLGTTWNPEVDITLILQNQLSVPIIITLLGTQVTILVSCDTGSGSITIKTPDIHVPLGAEDSKRIELRWNLGAMIQGTAYPIEVTTNLTLSSLPTDEEVTDMTTFVLPPYISTSNGLIYEIMPGYFSAKVATLNSTNLNALDFSNYLDNFYAANVAINGIATQESNQPNN